MSDVARAWAAAQDAPNRNAKDVLKEMANWADATGEAWVLVGVLAKANQCTERTVQRGLADLRASGLIIDTGEKRRHGGRQVPIYQLPIETGHANLIRRLRAESEAAKAGDNTLTGDSGVTRSEGLGVTVVSPDGCQPCHPTGDSGVTQIGNRNSQELTLSARACASDADASTDGAVDDPHLTEAMAAWVRKAPERVGPERVRPAWGEALAKARWSPERMAAAVTACVARDPDFGRGKAMNLDRWLAEERWRSWDRAPAASADAAAGSARATWPGPNPVRDVVAAAMGARGVASYLDPAAWDEARQVVLAATRMGADRLRDAVGRELTAMGMGIEFGSAGRG